MIEQDKKDILNVLKELSNSMTRIEAEREYIKEAVEAASEKFQLPKKQLRKMAKVYHKNTFADELTEMEEFQQLYESIVMP